MKEINWTTLKKVEAGAQIHLERRATVQYVYDRYLQILAAHNVPIKDFVVGAFFKNNPRREFMIVQNKFPYDVEDDIEHLIVWINPKCKPTEKKLRAAIKKKYEAGNFILFKNESGTIPEIEHYQLFIKK